MMIAHKNESRIMASVLHAQASQIAFDWTKLEITDTNLEL